MLRKKDCQLPRGTMETRFASLLLWIELYIKLVFTSTANIQICFLGQSDTISKTINDISSWPDVS